jgi:hypothetical protein
MLRMGIDPLMGRSRGWRSMRQPRDIRLPAATHRSDFPLHHWLLRRDATSLRSPATLHPNPSKSLFTVSNHPFSGW